MSEPVTPREFELLMETVRDGFDGIHERLDKLNDRTRKNESSIAVLESADSKSLNTSIAALITAIAGAIWAMFKG